MGLMKKLEYLKETVSMFLAGPEKIKFIPCNTLREYAKYMENYFDTFFAFGIGNDIVSSSTHHISDELGTIDISGAVGVNILIFPPIRHPISSRNTIFNKNILYRTQNIEYMDISKISCPYEFNVYNTAIYTLKVGRIFTFAYNAFKYPPQDKLFSRGLILGSHAVGMVSSWILNNPITTEKRVICGNNFIGSMYLSKIPMSADTMVGLFYNLKNLNGTGEKYTFNVGTENLAKLTEAQKNIAKSKGWNLT